MFLSLVPAEEAGRGRAAAVSWSCLPAFLFLLLFHLHLGLCQTWKAIKRKIAHSSHNLKR
ncbi:hypothetical protein PZA11_001733 [Diplocarpon coronariae]